MTDTETKKKTPYTWYTTAEQVVEMEDTNMKGKYVVITGATSGIGAETARVLYKRGANVFIFCRNMDKANAMAESIRKEGGPEAGSIEPIMCNLASFKSIREAAAAYKDKNIPIHVLINNAGVMSCPYAETEDGLEMQMGTNYFGHFLLTNLLMDELTAGQPSRVVNVSSLGHTMDGGKIYFDDMKGKDTWYPRLFGSWYAYAQAKSANVLFTVELQRRFNEKGLDIQAYSLHPGVVRTELGRHMSPLSRSVTRFLPYFFKDVGKGAATSVFLAVSPDIKSLAGQYFSDCKPAVAAKLATDPDIAKKLWQLSVKTVGLEETSQ